MIVRSQRRRAQHPALLLSGRGEILAHFEVDLERGRTTRLLRLRLTPRKADPEMETRPRGRGRRRAGSAPSRWTTRQGNRSRFRFDELRENVGLSDKLFRFEVPPGVEVITG